MSLLLGTLGLIAGTALIAYYGYECEKHGEQKGYTSGRRDADKWWLEMEQQVRETQKEIWREK